MIRRDGGYDFRDQSEVKKTLQNNSTLLLEAIIILLNFIQVYFEGNNTYSSLLLADRATKIIAEHNPETPLFLYLPFQV